MKNWEIIDGEYTRKVMWINHEIEMKLYYNGEDEIDGEEVDESKVEGNYQGDSRKKGEKPWGRCGSVYVFTKGFRVRLL